jgi:CHAD domain-containing protein
VSALQERELKLDVPEGFTLPDLDGEQLPVRTFVSTYFDSADRLLSRAGITLRRRVEDGRSAWQLKLPRADHRLELEEEGGELPPERLTGLLAGILRGRPLAPFSVLRTVRDGVRIRRSDHDVADVVFDRVSVLDGSQVASSFEEVEVELIQGSEDDLVDLRERLVDAGARDGDGRPKALRSEGSSAAEPDSGTAVLAEMLRRQCVEIHRHDPGVRLGDDPEDLHDLRVAVRRLRAILRAARGSLDPEPTELLRNGLRWLGQALGPARDLDVLVDHLRDAAGEQLDDDDRQAFEPLLDRLGEERKHHYRAVTAALDSERYARLLEALEAFVAHPPLTGKLSLSDVARRELKRAKKVQRALGDRPTDDELHGLRIKAKRLRYAAELAAPLVGRRAKRVVKRARALQDVLGGHQDSVVAEGRLRALAGDAGPTAALAAGRLVEGERLRRGEARTAWPRAWARLERAAERAFA